MKKKALIGIGIVVLALLVVVPQGAYAQPCTTNIFSYVLNETGYGIDNASVEWINNDTGEPIGNCTTFPTESCFMTHTWVPAPDTFDSLIRASKPCYMSNSTVIEDTQCSVVGYDYHITLILGKDEAGPTITNLQPADGSSINNNTPAICANYSDPNGINVSSVKIFVDDNDETANATVEEDYVCYTPITALPDGLHNVTVNVSDNCTNSNSISWSFTVDTIAPTIEFIPPTPANDSLNTTGCVNVTVNVTDPTPGSGLEDIINVSVWNETGMIYLNNETMQAFDEHKYYYNVFSPDGAPLPDGNYTYKVYAKDVAGNTRVSETRVVKVNVTEYTVSVTLESGYNMISLPANDTSVTNASLLIAKIGANCTEIFKWNKTSQGWESYNQYMPPAAAFDVVGGDGYFVSMGGPAATVEFSGMGWESPFSISLVTGYNTISLPVNDTSVTNASLLLAKIGANCTEIFKWNKTSQGWESFNPSMPPAAAFNIVGGEGCFMSMVGPADVTFVGEPWHE
ncbi:MAG: hypothetical protein KAT65_20635 [Methanophagales archaeon]|nr:hypothetical protein [Methanophagales archaeon]